MPIIPFKLPFPEKIKQAEKEVFDKAAQSKQFKAEDIYIFHSIRFMETGKKLVGEVDFIYIDKDCILFLEVKGGRVYYSSMEDKWWTQDGQIDKDPFDQVCSYVFDFRDKKFLALPENRAIKNSLVLGYGVMFPECKKPDEFAKSYNKNHYYYKQDSIEYAHEIVYDFTDHATPKGLENYILRLKQYWSNHASSRDKKFIGLDPDQLLRLKNYFRKDIKFEIPIPEYFQRDEKITKKYTEQQFEILQQLIDNPQVSYIINGGPGTGKTLMALEYAMQLNTKGKKVLILCYNRPLAFKLQSDITKMLSSKGISENLTEVWNVHRFMTSKLEGAGQVVNVQMSNSYFFNDLPDQFHTYFGTSPSADKFDYLIIDEGQDIFFEKVINAISHFLIGGFESNNWTVFIDKHYQSIYGSLDSHYYALFKNLYKPFEIKLNKNCRNTPQIIEKAHFHTGVENTECLKLGNFETEVIFYGSDQDFINKLNLKIIKTLAIPISPDDITILTSARFIEQIILSSPTRYEKINDKNVNLKNGKIKVSTPHSFKGLENRIVIFGGYDKYDPENKQLMSEYYVAYTRATTILILLFSDTNRSIMEKFVDKQILS